MISSSASETARGAGKDRRRGGAQPRRPEGKPRLPLPLPREDAAEERLEEARPAFMSPEEGRGWRGTLRVVFRKRTRFLEEVSAAVGEQQRAERRRRRRRRRRKNSPKVASRASGALASSSPARFRERREFACALRVEERCAIRKASSSATAAEVKGF